MTMRLLAVVLAVATLLRTPGLCADAVPAGRPHDLTIATLDNAKFDPLDSGIVRGFAGVAGATVRTPRWTGGITALRDHLADAAEPWDVVLLSAVDLRPACEQGLLEKFDWRRLGGRDHFVAAGVSDCGVGAEAHALVLAWDRDKLAGTPAWADFWDVVKNPGKRGLRRVVRGNLEIALLADGVANSDVYRLLRTADGLDRAFRKLDQLKPYIDWWQTGSQATKILGSGEVLMTSAPNMQITAASRDGHRNFGIQWAGSLLSIDSWAIVKGSVNSDAAYRFLAYAEDARQQAPLATAGYGWLEKSATENQEMQLASPTGGDHLATGLVIDEAFWRENLDKLTSRFEAWLAAH